MCDNRAQVLSMLLKESVAARFRIGNRCFVEYGAALPVLSALSRDLPAGRVSARQFPLPAIFISLYLSQNGILTKITKCDNLNKANFCDLVGIIRGILNKRSKKQYRWQGAFLG